MVIEERKSERVGGMTGTYGLVFAFALAPLCLGVGDKTAAKLLQQFGSVEEIYEGVADIKGDRLRRTLEENREQAEMSKTLAVLTKDLPLELDAEDQRLGRWDLQVVREVFSQLEFKTLLERFETQLAGAEDSTPDLQVNAITVEDLGGKARVPDALVPLRRPVPVMGVGGAST